MQAVSNKVDVSKMGSGSLTAQLINLKNRENYPFELIETQMDLYTVKFLPKEPGYFNFSLLFNNRQIKGKYSLKQVVENFCLFIVSIKNLCDKCSFVAGESIDILV